MNSNAGILVLLAIAVAAANLPFLTRRIFFIAAPRGHGEKALAWRLLELVVLYFGVGLLARFLEAQAHGTAYPQNWEFYAVTLCLFVVFAFPGFVYRYLWRARV